MGSSQFERPRLAQMLERHAQARLVLIHAPAGYGKTTLMTQWYQRLRQQGQSAAWVWLDEDDNDPGRLGSVLSQALVPDAAARLDLFEAINRCLSPGRFTLFLDDAECLAAEEAVQLLEVLLDFSPAALQLIIGSRAVPQKLALRLRLRDGCVEITARDLAFRTDEIVSFMQSRCGVTLAPQITAALERATEGWAAALQIAAVQIAQGEPPQNVCARLSAPQSDVFEYLSDEMLVHLRPQQREFLVRTSFLLELYAPLCDAVTGRSDAERQLAQLQRANLLLQPVDVARQCYRYHPLLAQLLRRQLQQQYPSELPGLARRAVDWCTREQMHKSAAEYALLADDPELLTSCIERCLEPLITHAQFATAKRWLHAIAPEVLRRRTNLLIWSAWVDIWTNDFGAAAARLAELERLGSGQPVDHRQQVMQAMLGVLLDILHERYDQALATLQAVAPPPAANREIRARLDNLNALLAVQQGRFGDAARHSEHALALATHSPPIWLSVVHAAHISGMAELSLGNLPGALRQLQLPERLLADASAEELADVNPSALLATLCCTRALTLYQLNRLEDAEDYLDRYGPFLGSVFSPTAHALWYQLRVRLHLLRGDEEGCLSILSEGSAYAIRNGIGWMQQLMQWERVDFDVTRGDIHHARSLAAGLLDGSSLASELQWIPACKDVFGPTIVALRFLIRSNESRRALELLRPHAAHAARQLRRLRLIRLRVLEALALQGLGEHTDALETLRQALELGRQSAAIRLFVDEGAECLSLLRELEPGLHAARREVEAVYVRTLLGAFDGIESETEVAEQAPTAGAAIGPPAGTPAGTPEGTPAGTPAGTPLLSARESQILQRLSRGYSNLAVGQQLFLSPNTVKWHLRQIYAKLGVHNRTQAVHVARQLRLVQMP